MQPMGYHFYACHLSMLDSDRPQARWLKCSTCRILSASMRLPGQVSGISAHLLYEVRSESPVPAFTQHAQTEESKT